MYILYMLPAEILARINIIFPVLPAAEGWLEKSTRHKTLFGEFKCEGLFVLRGSLTKLGSLVLLFK